MTFKSTTLAACLKLASVTKWKVQNNTPEKVFVSTAFGQKNGMYVSQGWWKCLSVVLRRIARPCGHCSGPFLYAKNGNNDVWKGENFFGIEGGKTVFDYSAGKAQIQNRRIPVGNTVDS
jgi:hypothetical protein